MSGNVTYQLNGYGRIEAAWVQHCLQLFKSNQVSIRKLLLLKEDHPEHYVLLELQFILDPPQCEAFLPHLSDCVAQLHCEHKQLTPITG